MKPGKEGVSRSIFAKDIPVRLRSHRLPTSRRRFLDGFVKIPSVPPEAGLGALSRLGGRAFYETIVYRLFARPSSLNALMRKTLRILRNRDFLLMFCHRFGVGLGRRRESHGKSGSAGSGPGHDPVGHGRSRAAFSAPQSPDRPGAGRAAPELRTLGRFAPGVEFCPHPG